MACVVVAPSLFLGGGSAEVVLLAAAAAAVFVFLEYAPGAPSLVEFRDAPPYNRIRFAVLAACLSVGVVLSMDGAGPLPDLVRAIATVAGAALDVAGSPLAPMVGSAPPALRGDVAAMGGTGLIVMATACLAFARAARDDGWPFRQGTFNPWINLPTFDPQARDVVARLRRDGTINVALGFAVLYLSPSLAMALGGLPADGPLLLIWIVSLWVLVPFCLILRGIALRRLAQLLSRAPRHGGWALG